MNPLLGVALLFGAAVAVALAFRPEQKHAPQEQSKQKLRAFISFDFDHNLAQKTLFAGQCSKDSPTPFTVQDWSSKEALPQKQWERVIFEKIGRCHMMFVLVSPTAHKASGVAKEIQMAIEQRVPLVGVYVAGADESTLLPKGLSRDRTVPWKWERIAVEVDRMAKNAQNRF